MIYLSIPPSSSSTLSTENASWFPPKPASNYLRNKLYLLGKCYLKISVSAALTLRYVHFFIFISCISKFPLPFLCTLAYDAPTFYNLHTNLSDKIMLNLLKPTGYVIHEQFNIQQLYALPTLYLCVLYLFENKQRIVPLTVLTDWFL